MKFTTRPDLPEPLIKALTQSDNDYIADKETFLFHVNEPHDFEISATQLPKAPRQIILFKRNHKYIEIDPLRNWFVLQGNIIHYILEKYAPAHWQTEVREHCIVTVDGKKVLLTCKYDAYDTKEHILYDWKYVNAFSMLYPKDDYEFQLNVGYYMLSRKGMKIKHLKNVYLFRHRDKGYEGNPLYPIEDALVKDVEIWPIDVTEKKIKERIRIHLKNKELDDTKLDFCTDSERWIRGNEWKVYKRTKPKKKADPPGEFSSRATFSALTEQECIDWLEENKQTEETKIREIKGEPVLCRDCQVVAFCNQRQKELEEISNEYQ